MAKNVFQIHGVDEAGRVAVRRALRRAQMHGYFQRLKPCLIGMEACGGAHYWARELAALGHTVRLMAPIFVKPYVKGNKNDCNDAAAICEAVSRPSMRFVAVKTPAQQAVLHLHHSRALLVRERIALTNHLRALLLEQGIAIGRGRAPLMRALPEILEDGENGLPWPARACVGELAGELKQLEARIGRLEAELKHWHNQTPASQRLVEVPGIGLLTATALAASVGDGAAFANGRELAAYLGLVPRQASSGGKQRLLGISKRGDGYLRRLLIHGARAVIRHVRQRLRAGKPGGNPWVEQLLARAHPNVVAAALANKMARTAWVLLVREEHYRPSPQTL